MTDYRTDDGQRVGGGLMYAMIRSKSWLIEDVDEDTGVWVLTDEDGEQITLTPIPGTEGTTTGPVPF